MTRSESLPVSGSPSRLKANIRLNNSSERAVESTNRGTITGIVVGILVVYAYRNFRLFKFIPFVQRLSTFSVFNKVLSETSPDVIVFPFHPLVDEFPEKSNVRRVNTRRSLESVVICSRARARAFSLFEPPSRQKRLRLLHQTRGHVYAFVVKVNSVRCRNESNFTK